MNILMINYEFPPLGGGGGIFSHDLAREFAKKHKVDIITSHYKGLSRKATIGNITIYRVPVLRRTSLHAATMISLLSFPFSGTIKGVQLFLKNKYDIIHTHFAVPTGPAGLVLSRIFRVPNVLSIHGGDIYDPSKKLSPHRHAIFRWAVRTTIDNAVKVVAQSTNIRDYAVKIYHSTKDIAVIPLGIPEPDFEPVDREELSIRKGSFYIISVGRLVKRKGYETLIKALSIVRKKGHDVYLILIGDGPERKTLERLSADLKISDFIMFLGAVSHKRKFQYLSASDVYVLSSLHEGFGIVLLEAMISRLPIIATDEGGQTDIVVDGRNGILVRHTDGHALANAIITLMKDAPLRQAIVNSNVEDVDKFKISIIAEQYLELFHNIAYGKRNELGSLD